MADPAPTALLAARASDLPDFDAAVVPGSIRWIAGDLRTGEIQATLPMVSTSWATAIDDAGTLGGTLILADPAIADLEPRVTVAPCTRFLGVEYLDPDGASSVLQAGPVWTHSYDDDKATLAIAAAGLWSYYDHRYVIPLLGLNTPATAAATHTGGMSTLAKKLVELAHEYTGGSLPVVLPDDEPGTNTRTYNGFDLLAVGEALRNLADGDNAIEIHFQPRRNPLDPTHLEWVLRAGTSSNPTLTQDGDDHVWNISVPRRSLSSLSIDVDGSAMASRMWCPASGSDELKVIGRADDLSLVEQGYPLLESEVPGRENVELQTTADSYANEAVQRSQAPVERWDASVDQDDAPRLGSYFPGDWVRFAVASHLYLAPGDYRTRLMGFSGDDSTKVKLQLAPTIGGL